MGEEVLALYRNLQAKLHDASQDSNLDKLSNLLRAEPRVRQKA